MHTPGAQVSKSMHPAAKMCTQGAALISNTVYRCLEIKISLSNPPPGQAPFQALRRTCCSPVHQSGGGLGRDITLRAGAGCAGT